MIRRAALLAFFGIALSSTGASAGAFTDDMSKCLVRSATADDQLVLIKWMFAAFALNPDIAPLSAITAEQRAAFNQQTADLMQRLVFVDCREQTVAALKNEGAASLQTGFSVLGYVAARGLMTNPTTAIGMLDLAKRVDAAKLRALFQDAGLPAPPIAFGH
jgi:hypothetical protein